MIGETVSKYKILRKLGEGGMGEVYLAEDTELNRQVALKFIPDELASNAEALARFKREAQTAAALNHPNIVTVHEVGQHKGRPYIAMAYVDGEPLADLITGGGLTVDRVIEITLQILDGLSNAHQAGIVHRDIKPGNLFIDREGRVKILDFGLAKPGGAGKLTGELSTMGTIFYMSPEQTRGDEVDERSDLFSIGAVLYEMLAGRPPFEGKHIAAVVYSITNEEPKPLSGFYQRIPRAMEQVVSKALAKNPEDRYQSAAEMAADLRRLQAGLRPLAARRGDRLLKFVVPTTVVFLAVAIFFVVKPLRFQVSGDQPAVAAENSLAIMYFENVVEPEDPRRLGEIASNLLITDLSESGNMEVISSQRLYDILKLKGKEGVKVIDKDTATEVAKEARAKWMLMGSILQEEPSFIMTSRLVDVETGRVAASQRITGEPGEQIFALVDRLTQEVRNDLALPAASRGGRDVAVAEVTTHSTEAYRYYLEGMEHLNKFYQAEAKAAFKKALEYDSTFAMVYLRLGSGTLSASRVEQKRAIEKAVQYSDKVSKKEKHYIDSAAAVLTGDTEKAVAELEAIIREYPNEKNAYKALGDIYRSQNTDPKAIDNYRKAIEIDPLDKFSYNVLAYEYQRIGDVDNYIWAIYQYMALAPNEANPYDSRADLYAYSGKLDKAIESYSEALKRKPDFYPSVAKLGYMHLFKREYDQALGYFGQLLASPEAEYRALGRVCQILVPLYQGKLDEALDVANRAIAADEAERYRGKFLFLKQWYLVEALFKKGDVEGAVEKAERIAAQYEKEFPEEPLEGNTPLLRVLIGSGDIERATAVLGAVKKNERINKSRAQELLFWEGMVDMGKGNFDAACGDFEKADPSGESFHAGWGLALALWKAGRGIESVNHLEKLLRRYSEERAVYPFEAVMSYYYLGVASEELGRTDEAIAGYEEFLGYWGDGDPAIEEIADAKSRLARLRQPG